MVEPPARIRQADGDQLKQVGNGAFQRIAGG